MVPGGVFNVQRRRLADLALRAGLPIIASEREIVEAGALMSYGESARDFNRRAAFFVDKIMRGAMPADLPVGAETQIWDRWTGRIGHARGDTLALDARRSSASPDNEPLAGTMVLNRLISTDYSTTVLTCRCSQTHADENWPVRASRCTLIGSKPEEGRIHPAVEAGRDRHVWGAAVD